jgi:phage terminase Nu1 subunit (DNA packaging protein)
MAVTPQLWTLNGLAVELKIYRSKLATALATLPPDIEDERGTKKWLMARVVKHLQGQGAGPQKLDRGQEDARLKRAQADKLEMELALRRGELVAAEDVGEYLAGILSALRAKMLALPKRLAPVVIGLKKPAEVSNRMEKDVHEALLELAGLDPDEAVKALRKNYKTGDGEEDQA